MHDKTITVLGAGYVGLTTAALLAHSGYKVYVIEPNPKRLDVIKQGRSFFYETGLDSVISSGIEAGLLVPTNSYEAAVPKSSIVFSCVGTPDNPDGSSNLTYVFSAAEEAAKFMKKDTVYVQKSTVPVGTGSDIEKLFEKLGVNASYISNPEFLREGTAIKDTLYFDRVVAGGQSVVAVDRVLAIYHQLEKNRHHIAHIAGIEPGMGKGQYISTSLNSAELIKVTANAFLALKISFANSIAKLADKVDADVTEVMDAVGADERIGRAFLNAGRGYGGGCFPKDVSGLISSGLKHGVDLDIMNVTQQVNESMVGYIVEKLQLKMGSDVSDKKIAVLGLAFKAGTSDARRSPGVAIANLLDERGAKVTAYDPQSIEEASDELRKGVSLVSSTHEAIKGADVVIVATEWSEFVDYAANDYADGMKGKLFIDAINQFDRESVEDTGLTYVGVGR